MKPLKMAAAVVAALVTIIGGAWALERHWTPRSDFAEMGKAFQQYQVEQSLDKTTDRLWSTEDRLKKQPDNEELQGQYRELLERKKRLEQQLNVIEKGGS
jgi:hypothetical protein